MSSAAATHVGGKWREPLLDSQTAALINKEGCTQGPSTVVPSAAAFPSLSTSSWVPASLPGSRREESCLAATLLVEPRKAASHPQNRPQLYKTGCQQGSVACIDQA